MNKTNEQTVLTAADVHDLNAAHTASGNSEIALIYATQRAVLAKLGAVAGHLWLQRHNELCDLLVADVLQGRDWDITPLREHGYARILPTPTEATVKPALQVDGSEAGAVPLEWKPTAENINALPEPIRDYIHELAANADPAGMVAENALIKDQLRGFESLYAGWAIGDRRCSDCKLNKSAYCPHNSNLASAPAPAGVGAAHGLLVEFFAALDHALEKSRPNPWTGRTSASDQEKGLAWGRVHRLRAKLLATPPAPVEAGVVPTGDQIWAMHMAMLNSVPYFGKEAAIQRARSFLAAQPATVAQDDEEKIRTDISQPCPHCPAAAYYHCAHPFRSAPAAQGDELSGISGELKPSGNAGELVQGDERAALRDLDKLVQYSEDADDHGYGTVASDLVREMTEKARAALARQLPANWIDQLNGEYERGLEDGRQQGGGDAELHPNHIPDLRYILAVLERLSKSKPKDDELSAAVNGMRYIVSRTEDAARAQRAAALGGEHD